MGNLYRLNSLFELEIRNFPNKLTIDKRLLERSTAFEYLFLLISNIDDYTLISEKLNPEIIEYWRKMKISFGKAIETNNPYYEQNLILDKSIPQDVNLIEWGKTSILNQEKRILEKRKNQIYISDYLNSKINQTRWKEISKLNQVTSVICSNRFEIEYAVSTLKYPFAIKSEFGFSGKGTKIIQTGKEAIEFLKDYSEILMLNPNGVIIEEWVGENRIEDFSGVFDVKRKSGNLLAITKMLVDKNGGYKGSIIQKNFGSELKKKMTTVINSYSRLGSSYNGPMTLDGFSFRDENAIKFQYMSEINARYSMGRILIEINKKLGKEGEDCGLFFLPIKNKNLSFNSLLVNLEKIKSQFKTEIILVTPLMKSDSKNNSFAGFYLRNENTIPLEIIDSIKAILA